VKTKIIGLFQLSLSVGFFMSVIYIASHLIIKA
jgi:hypothetical protein